MKPTMEERIVCSSWHMFIALLGLFEIRKEKTRLGKILSVGLILFHADGAIADIINEKSLSRRLFEYLNEKRS